MTKCNVLLLLTALLLLLALCLRPDTAAPLTGESAPLPEAGPLPVRGIDLNTAAAEELRTLPGIGDSLAERILAYREEYGPFRSPSELLLVEGIGEQTLNRIFDITEE